MRVHFIAIGGSIMHNMAIALKKAGHDVSGSDDIIYDPARSRLAAQDLLPDNIGWNDQKITTDIDLVILGMHAHADNPELKRALDLKIPVKSFPEYLGEHGKDKKVVAVCGSHGKTTTTSMIMHILQVNDYDFDYAVGARIPGFEDMVKISDAPLIIIEGDEYLSSPMDARPKFLHYSPDIAVITGIAWDHINVFPTYEEYLDAFRQLVNLLDDKQQLIYNSEDDELVQLINSMDSECKRSPFPEILAERHGTDYSFNLDGKIVHVALFGYYNYLNLMAAWQVCRELGLGDKAIHRALKSLVLPDKRMDELVANDKINVYRDYAHAPSKVRACLNAFAKLADHGSRLAVLELHTYSSLNRNFIPQYKDVFSGVNHPILFYNPKNLEIKRLPSMSDDYIRQSFNCDKLVIINDPEELQSNVERCAPLVSHVMLMSSSNFAGIDWRNVFESSIPD